MRCATRVSCIVAAALSFGCQSAAPGAGQASPPPVGQMGVPGAPGSTTNAVAPSSAGAGALASSAMSLPAANSGGSAAASMSVPAVGTAGTPAPIDSAAKMDEIVAMRDPAKDAWMGFGGGLDQTFARPTATIEKSNLSMIGEAWEKMAPGA